MDGDRFELLGCSHQGWSSSMSLLPALKSIAIDERNRTVYELEGAGRAKYGLYRNFGGLMKEMFNLYPAIKEDQRSAFKPQELWR